MRLLDRKPRSAGRAWGRLNRFWTRLPRFRRFLISRLAPAGTLGLPTLRDRMLALHLVQSSVIKVLLCFKSAVCKKA